MSAILDRLSHLIPKEYVPVLLSSSHCRLK
jgi:hypothetical protein